MKTQLKHHGVVVPMVTPLTATGTLDEPAVDRLVESLLAGKVNGIFVFGTTGEGARIPRSDRRRLLERVVAKVQSRALIYAGIGGIDPNDTSAGNEYVDAGADATVARAPISMSVSELQPWFQALLDRSKGPVILYNIPTLTKVSIPLDVVESLLGHPRLAGMKDSENNLERLTTLLHRFGSRPGFSIFVGVGKLMEQGLRLGAHGIVPSVGNLIPITCHQLWQCAQCGDWSGARQHATRMNSVATLYQAGRDLDESLSALKGALSLQGVCQKYMFPPIKALDEAGLQSLAVELNHLNVVTGRETASLQPSPDQNSSTRAFLTL